MELAADTRLIAQYSPTSTPILDVLRPVPHESRAKLSAGEYFFLCSAVILVLIGLQDILRVLEALGSKLPDLALIGLLVPACCLGAAALVHELGHLLAGKIAGFRLAGLNLSSAAGSNSYEGQKLDACQVLPLGILVLEPGKTDRLPRRLTILLLGGPLASLLAPLVLEASQYWAQHFLLNVFLNYAVHVFTAVSVLVGLAALLPDVSRRGNFSDGARLLMLAKKDELAARWLAILKLQMALGRGEHPRKWDESSVFRATAVNDGSRDAVTAMWLAYLWASERQDITSATRYLEDALAAPRASSAWLRDRLFVEAAVFQAWFRDNPGKARSWVAQIHGRKLTPLQQQRLNIALLWAEGRLFDAWEKTAECFRLLAAMPDSPARDLAKQSVEEWKRQMESRMLTRAWRTMYSLSHQMDAAVRQTELSSS
ncbi:MAG: hypothetical protein LAO20_19910 [Acidobacteriia bacterium]|nr:hypothetical protein [Terriglobia bacterium]